MDSAVGVFGRVRGVLSGGAKTPLGTGASLSALDTSQLQQCVQALEGLITHAQAQLTAAFEEQDRLSHQQANLQAAIARALEGGKGNSQP
jgi:hypothetical protein